MTDAPRTEDVSIPGRVWDDFLNPDVSEMQHDLGLTTPVRQKAGKGYRVIYHGLTPDVAAELAGYLHDRADTLLGQSISDPDDPFEKAARDTYRAAIKASERIRETLAWNRDRYEPGWVYRSGDPAPYRKERGA